MSGILATRFVVSVAMALVVPLLVGCSYIGGQPSVEAAPSIAPSASAAAAA